MTEYEVNIASLRTDTTIQDAMNRAYAIVSYMTHLPIRMITITYSASDIDDNQLALTRPAELGCFRVYRAWWARNTGDFSDLKESLYTMPIHDPPERTDNRLPSPLREYRAPIPQVRMFPERVGKYAETGAQLYPPRTYLYLNNRFYFDQHPSGGTGFRLRILGSFHPVSGTDVPVPLLSLESNNRLQLPPLLWDAVVFLAFAELITPYPDLIEVQTYYRSLAMQTINEAVQTETMNTVSWSIHGVLEQQSGVVVAPARQASTTETNRRKR